MTDPSVDFDPDDDDVEEYICGYCRKGWHGLCSFGRCTCDDDSDGEDLPDG